MVEQPKWYVIHTYSGHEKKIKATLEKLVQNSGMEDLIVDIAVPTEEVVKKTKSGKKKIVERQIFPGYVLVKMIVTTESWYVVRNAKGVINYVGPDAKPVPLSDEEVRNMGLEQPDGKPSVQANFEVGDRVNVKSGPFKDFDGVVEHIDNEKATAKVLVSMFGRKTPVELKFNQVTKK